MLQRERIDPDMDVNITKVKQQKGVRDCGLFGTALAYHLAAGDAKAIFSPGRNETSPFNVTLYFLYRNVLH